MGESISGFKKGLAEASDDEIVEVQRSEAPPETEAS